jgi:hypothetical protein
VPGLVQMAGVPEIRLVQGFASLGRARSPQTPHGTTGQAREISEPSTCGPVADLLLVIMLCHVVLCGFVRMLGSQDMMSACKVSVMPRLFVRACLVMLGCLLMVPGGVLVVFCRFFVMLCPFMFSHLYSPM